MKLFINESRREIKNNIYGFIKEHSWKLDSDSDNSIVAIKDQKYKPMNYIWDIEPIKVGFMVAFNLKYPRIHTFLLLLTLIYSTLILIYLILSLHIGYIKWNWMFLITSFLVIIPLSYRFFIKPLLNQMIMNKKMYDFFSKNLDVKIIDPYHSNSIWSMWFYLVSFSTLATLFTSVIYQSVIYGLMFCIASILSLIIGTNAAITQSDEGMFARRLLLDVMTGWIFFTLISVFLITSTMMIHSVNICNIEMGHYPLDLIDVLNYIFLNSDEFIFHEDNSIAILNPQHWNLTQFTSKKRISMVFLNIYPLLVILIGIVIIRILNRWPKRMSKSTRHILKDKGTITEGVVSKTKAKHFYNLGVILIWIIGTIVNVTHFILTVSIVYWFFTDNFLFLSQFIFKLSWVKYFPQQYDSTLLYFLWYSLILILITPSMIITYNIVRTVCNLITNFWGRTKKADSSNTIVENIVMEECLKENRIPPKIKSLDESNGLIYSQKSIFSRSGTISINPIVIEKLSSEELKAVVLHELGHLKNDINKLNLLKSLSFIGLFPFPILCLLLDFVKLELEADQFAITRGTQRDTLQSSIIKMNVLKQVVSSRNKTIKPNAIINKFNLMFLGLKLLLFYNKLLSYNYPIDELRLANLQTLDNKND